MRRRPFAFRSPREASFWDAWTRRHGKSLRCQYRVGSYRCDFAHPATQTIVEIDGDAWHNDPESRRADAARDAELGRHGWRVVRFRGREILGNVAACVARVEAVLAERRAGSGARGPEGPA